MSDARSSLDPRAWLLWGMAASLVPLLGRNPFALTATLLAVVAVRAAWVPAAAGVVSGAGLVRLAMLFAAVGVVFNALTVHVGDRELARLPDRWPIVGGALTLNAVTYGVLSGVALVILVLVGTTLSVVLDLASLLRLVPARLAPVAVAGSVAVAFAPQTATALREIREAQAARGHRPRGARDLVPLLVPLLTGGLERAVTTAEALEARGFGATLGAGPAARWRWRGPVAAFGLAATVSGVFAAITGQATAGLLAIGGGVGLVGLAARDRRGRAAFRRTRYREAQWSKRDTALALASVATALALLRVRATDPGAVAWEPYPALTVPQTSLPLLAGLLLLLAPVLLAPPAGSDR